MVLEIFFVAGAFTESYIAVFFAKFVSVNDTLPRICISYK